MKIYVDYEYYHNQYLGRRLTEDEFAAYVPRASALITEMTGGRATAMSDCDEVKYACCAVCEQMLINDRRAGISSETVGKKSYTYSTKTSTQLCLDAARAYLINTGLLGGTGVKFYGVE